MCAARVCVCAWYVSRVYVCVCVCPTGEDSQNAKRFQGMASSTLKRIEETLSAAHPPNTPAGTYLRTVDPGYRVADIVSWLGRGVPLPPSDPAAICCFISIPGELRSVCVCICVCRPLTLVSPRQVQMTDTIMPDQLTEHMQSVLCVT